jgi:cell division septal protein FtsQ
MTTRRGQPAARPARPAATRPGIRRGSGRRTRPIRRASAGITPVRAAALLVLLAALAGLYGLAASSAFTAKRTAISGTTWTPQADIIAALDIPAGQNLFTLNTALVASRLDGIPAVEGVKVTVALPDEVRVAVTERQALLVWQASGHRFLVDGTGMLFADLGDSPSAAAASLPVVVDQRSAATLLVVGSTLDGVILDAALRLGSLTPSDLDSSASGLGITVDDSDGFKVTALPAGWTAVFGFYTPTLRTTDLIPGQVRLLRSLLFGREDKVGRIILADDRSGTYLPIGSPEPTAKPKATAKPTARPTATPRPSTTPRPTVKPTVRPAGASASPKPSATPKP